MPRASSGRLDRTYEELKPGQVHRAHDGPDGRLDRTYEELKHTLSGYLASGTLSLDRTYEELKHKLTYSVFRLHAIVWIVPMRN